MLTANDIMTSNPITIRVDADVTLAASLLMEHGFNGLPVLDGANKLVGVICQSDLIAQQKKLKLPSVFTLLDGLIPLGPAHELDREIEKITAVKVKQAMTANPITVTPETSIEDVATLMADKRLHTLPVVDGGVLVGVLGMADVLRTLAPKSKA